MAEDDRHIAIMDAESFSVCLHFRIYSPGPFDQDQDCRSESANIRRGCLGQIPFAQPWDHVGSVPIGLGGDHQEVS